MIEPWILVAGDAILDETIYVRIKGVSVEGSNSFVVEKLRTCYNLGGAGNVAANVNSLGDSFRSCLFSSSAGFSFWGDAKFEELAGRWQHVYWLRGDNRISVKTRVMTDAGTLLRIDDEPLCSAPAETLDLAAALAQGPMGEAPSLICLADYDKGFFPANAVVPTLHRALPALAQVPVLVDPGRRLDWWRYASPVTLFKVNAAQAQTYCGTHFTPGDYPAICKALARSCRQNSVKYRYLVVTFGSYGLCLVHSSGAQSYFSAEAPIAVDTCGAGDTVLAALAVKIAETSFEGADVYTACAFASRAAAVSVQKRGVVAVTREEAI